MENLYRQLIYKQDLFNPATLEPGHCYTTEVDILRPLRETPYVTLCLVHMHTDAFSKGKTKLKT